MFRKTIRGQENRPLVPEVFPSAEKMLAKTGWENANVRAKDVNINKKLALGERILYGLASFVDTLLRG